eukprot:TRINITY_DN24544_c0_g2_i1.p1 TRINITY_DN24544_c0_g2~~TRINITY_DN24544_c0_g2_i1.p1  ORF type:complete len:420 (-),score=98.39 TRINITY_DN24544_c0_g2_i1:35-1234(-)
MCIRDRNKTCPYNMEKLVFGMWRGTVAGCVVNGTSVERADKKKPKICLQSVKEMKPSSLTKWRGDEFCIQRLKNFTYTFYECDPGYRKCSEALCVREEEVCPITNVRIIENFDEDSINDTDIESIPLTGKKRRMVLNREFEVPVNSLSVSTNDYPCLSKYLTNKRLTPSMTLARIEDSKLGCGDFKDLSEYSGPEIIESTTEDELLHENINYEKAMSIPGFNESMKAKEMFHLTFQYHLNRFCEQCLKKFSPPDFNEEEAADYLISMIDWCWVLGISSIVFMVTMALQMVFNLKTGDATMERNIYKLYLVVLGVIIGLALKNYQVFSSLTDHRSNLASWLTSDCAQNNIKFNLENETLVLSKDIGGLITKNYIILSSSAILTIIIICLLYTSPSPRDQA